MHKKEKVVPIQEIFNDFNGYKLFFVNSALSAMYLILMFLKQKALITNKNDEILVPQKMKRSYYNTVNYVAFPSTYYSENIKGLIVYHQNGFGQNMEMIMSSAAKNNQFIIEDCSESLISYVNGRRLGTFSNFAIFDLSKYFPSIYGGVILTKENTFLDFISNFPAISSKIILNVYLISNLMNKKFPRLNLTDNVKKMFDENSQICFQLNKKQENNVKNKLFKSSIENRNILIKTLQKIDNINSLFQFNNYDKSPYSLYFNNNILQKNIIHKFNKIGRISKSKYDMNQNILNPNFIKTYKLKINPTINIKDINKIKNFLEPLTL